MSKVETNFIPNNLENNSNTLNVNADKNTETYCNDFNPMNYQANIQQELYIQRQVRIFFILV